MTGEQMVQQFMETTYTGADIFNFTGIMWFWLGEICTAVLITYSLYRLIKWFFDKLKKRGS